MSLWTFPLVFGMQDRVGMWQVPSHSCASASLEHRWTQPSECAARLSQTAISRMVMAATAVSTALPRITAAQRRR